MIYVKVSELYKNIDFKVAISIGELMKLHFVLRLSFIYLKKIFTTIILYNRVTTPSEK